MLNNTVCLAGTLNCRLLVNSLYFVTTFGKSATNHRHDKLLPLHTESATHGYTRNHYHDLTKKIKTDRNSAVKRSLGNALQSCQTRNFWSEIYKVSKAKGKKLSVVVNDLCTGEDIANSFAEQYELLCNSVISDPSHLLNIYNDIIVTCLHSLYLIFSKWRLLGDIQMAILHKKKCNIVLVILLC